MPVIPMNQTTTIHKVIVDTNNKPILDADGFPQIASSNPFKCRVDEGSYIVESVSNGLSSNQNVVASARIRYDKLVDIAYHDEIEYTNELGHSFKRPPKKINIIRGANGKPILTEVYL